MFIHHTNIIVMRRLVYRFPIIVLERLHANYRTRKDFGIASISCSGGKGAGDTHELEKRISRTNGWRLSCGTNLENTC